MKRQVSYLEDKGRLKGEYLETFEHIESFCRTEIMSEPDFEDHMGYLLDIFVTAQADCLPVSSITGGDIKDFCKGFLSDIRMTSIFRYIADMLKRLAWVAVVLIAADMLIEIASGEVSIWNAINKQESTAEGIIFGAILGIISEVVSSLIIRSFIFRIKKYRRIYHTIVRTAVFIITFAGVAFVCFNPDALSLNIPNAAVLTASVIYLIGYYLMRGIINTKRGRAFFSDGTERRRAAFSESVMTAMVGEFRSMYDKENAKRFGKGEPALTREKFAEKMDKDTKTSKLSLIAGCAAIAVGYIAGIISVAIDSTPADTLTFAAVLMAGLAILYPIIIHPLMVYPYIVRKRFFRILNENGKSVFDDDVYECISAYYENK